jgi:hypothetical protein
MIYRVFHDEIWSEEKRRYELHVERVTNEDHEVYVISWRGKFYLATVVRLSISSSFSICVMANRARLTAL